MRRKEKKYSSISKTNLIKLGRVVLSDKENVEYVKHKLGKFYYKLCDVDFVQMFIDLIDEEYNVSDVEKLLFDNSKKVDDMFKMVVNNIEKNQNVEQNTKALKVLQMFETELGKAERGKYILLAYTIYGNTNSESLKKNVIQQIRAIKGTRTFKKFLTEEEKEKFALLAK